MALECRNHFLRRVVIASGIGYSVAVHAQGALQSDNRVASIAWFETGALKIKGRCTNPMTDVGVAQ